MYFLILILTVFCIAFHCSCYLCMLKINLWMLDNPIPFFSFPFLISPSKTLSVSVWTWFYSFMAIKSLFGGNFRLKRDKRQKYTSHLSSSCCLCFARNKWSHINHSPSTVQRTGFPTLYLHLTLTFKAPTFTLSTHTRVFISNLSSGAVWACKGYHLRALTEIPVAVRSDWISPNISDLKINQCQQKNSPTLMWPPHTQ